MNIEPVFASESRESNTRALPPSGAFPDSKFSSPHRSRSSRLWQFPEQAETTPTWANDFIKERDDGHKNCCPRNRSVDDIGKRTVVTRRASATSFPAKHNPARDQLPAQLEPLSPTKSPRRRTVARSGSFSRVEKDLPDGEVGKPEMKLRRQKEKQDDRLERQSANTEPSLNMLFAPSASEAKRHSQALQASRYGSKADPPGFLVDEISDTMQDPPIAQQTRKTNLTRSKSDDDSKTRMKYVGSSRKRKEKIALWREPSSTDAVKGISLPQADAPSTEWFRVDTVNKAVEQHPESLFFVPQSLSPTKRGEGMAQQRRASDLTCQTSNTTKSGSRDPSEPSTTQTVSTGSRTKSPTRRQRSVSIKKVSTKHGDNACASPRRKMVDLTCLTPEFIINRDRDFPQCNPASERVTSLKVPTLESPTKRVGRTLSTTSPRARISKASALLSSSPVSQPVDDDAETVITWTRVPPIRQTSKSSLEMFATTPSPRKLGKQTKSTFKATKGGRVLEISEAESKIRATKGKAVASNLTPLDFTEFQPEDFSAVEFDDPVVLTESKATAANQLSASEGNASFWSLTPLPGS
jgi:hypothetical protein